ncbi:MAG: hypothetical protein AAF447_13150 [Myxococcota bacterium]
MSASLRRSRPAAAPPALRPLPLPGQRSARTSRAQAAVALLAAPASRPGPARPEPALEAPPRLPGKAPVPEARALELLRLAHRTASPALGPAVRDMLDAAETILALEGPLRAGARGQIWP